MKTQERERRKLSSLPRNTPPLVLGKASEFKNQRRQTRKTYQESIYSAPSNSFFPDLLLLQLRLPCLEPGTSKEFLAAACLVHPISLLLPTLCFTSQSTPGAHKLEFCRMKRDFSRRAPGAFQQRFFHLWTRRQPVQPKTPRLAPRQ